MKEKIFIIQSERRNWEDRIKCCVKENKPIPPITRRYLMMTKDLKIRDLIKTQFTTIPYSDQHEDIFYCIAGHSFRRSREFVKALMYKMEKSFDKEILDEIEILEGVDAAETLMETCAEIN